MDELEIRRTLLVIEKEYKSWASWYCRKLNCTSYACIRRKQKLDEIETRRMLAQFELDLFLSRKKRICVD